MIFVKTNKIRYTYKWRGGNYMAFCQSCGKEIPNDSKFCPHSVATQSTFQNWFQSNMNFDQPFTVANDLPMNWYKFLIYVALFLGAIANVFTGFQMLTGGHYEGMSSWVYLYYPSLKTLDMVIGIASIGLAVFAIVVRQKLANYQSDGPKMLMILYVGSVLISVIYLIMVMGIVGGDIDSSTMIPSLAVSVVMIIVNKIYFDKRQHLFVN